MSKIHVIIPVYNAKKFLREAVDSVLNQPYKGIDIVLVNDGSTDGSAELCDEIAANEERVSVIHQANTGVSAARNAGIECVLKQCENEDYIAFLDADDVWCIDSIRKDYNVEENVDLICFSSYYANESLERFRVMNVLSEQTIIHQIGTVGWYEVGHLGANLFSTRVIREYHIRFPEGVKGNEDIIFMQKFGFCSKIIQYKPKFVYQYRLNNASVTHNAKFLISNAMHVPMAWFHEANWPSPLHNISLESKTEWEKECYQIAGARMLETLRSLVESGIRWREINTFRAEATVVDLLERISVENLANWQQEDYTLYFRSFTAFYLKFYFNGCIRRTAKKLLRIGAVRRWRERYAFPLSESIESSTAG